MDGIAGISSFYKFELVHARLRAHGTERERSERWIYAYRRYRHEAFWGSQELLDDALGISNRIKPLSRKISFDETVYDGSSLNAKGVHQYARMKNHDEGVLGRRGCDSMRGFGLIPDNAVSDIAANNFVGAGYTQVTKLEPGKNRRVSGPYEKAYGVFILPFSKF